MLNEQNAPAAKRYSTHSKRLPVQLDLTQPGRLRAGHLQTLYSISHSTLYDRIRKGFIPKPDGRDGKRPYWNTSTILASLNGG